MPDQNTRRNAGHETPRCPDCGTAASLPDGGDPRRHAPVGRHDATCPVGRAEDRQALADARILARRGAGAVLIRPLALGELAMLEMVGNRVPPRMRAAVEVHVIAPAPTLLLRTVVYRGRARAAMLATVPAGAL